MVLFIIINHLYSTMNISAYVGKMNSLCCGDHTNKPYKRSKDKAWDTWETRERIVMRNTGKIA